MRRLGYLAIALFLLVPVGSGLIGRAIGPGVLRPMRLNPELLQQTAEMLNRSGAAKEDFNISAPDGVDLRGWKVRVPSPNGDWVLLFHGVSDNRTGLLGHAEFLLRHGYSVLMMDSRAHGESGGDMATYGWKERYDTVALVNALYATEKVRHLYALGVSMGAAVALQSAAVETRIDGVVAEDPFAACGKSATTTRGCISVHFLARRCFVRRPFSPCRHSQAPADSIPTTYPPGMLWRNVPFVCS
jgi:pimeloyl-ACP methyl ester carboxylesterase